MDYIKIGVIALLLLILFTGISKSLKIKKLGYFLVALFIDIIIVLICYFGLPYNGEEEQTMKEEKVTENTTTSEKTTTKVKDERLKTSNGFVIEEKNGITYIDGYLVVNKTYSLPSDFVPLNTHSEPGEQKYCQSCIDNEAWDSYNLMKADAQSLGLNIYIASGYRSFKAQEGLYNNYVSYDGKEAADTYSARPGHSEHQTGLSFDLNSVTDDFAYTEEGKWVVDSCYKYGFIIRYPKGKENETGYKYEPWHLRYVGKVLAEKLYNEGNWITMEDYFGIKSEYAD